MNLDEKRQHLNDAFVILRQQGKIKTWSDFAELLDTNRSVLSAAKNGQEKYLTDSLMTKIDAVLTMPNVSINHSPYSNVATGNGQINVNSMRPDEQDYPDTDMVPVIPMNLYKESDVNILEYIQDDGNDVQMTPAIQQFPKTDAIYSVQTMAMYPHLHQGDLLALKVVKRTSPIINGEMYAIDTIDNGILIRFAYDRGDYIEMKASEGADRFESFNIYKKDIFNIFRVVGMIRTNI